MVPYITPLIGGVLIGISAFFLLFFLGRIASVGGIVWGAVSAQPDNAWRWLFVVGLVLGPLLYHTLLDTPYPHASPLQWWHAAIGGLLVGFGVRLGSGFTSSQGVLGVVWFSARYLVAAVIFMSTGIATLYIVRHLVPGL